jgi:hypothetical protein
LRESGYNEHWLLRASGYNERWLNYADVADAADKADCSEWRMSPSSQPYFFICCYLAARASAREVG